MLKIQNHCFFYENIRVHDMHSLRVLSDTSPVLQKTRLNILDIYDHAEVCLFHIIKKQKAECHFYKSYL